MPKARRRITKKTFAETYDELREHFGAPVDDEADERNDDSFGFARFRLRVCTDAGAGMYLRAVFPTRQQSLPAKWLTAVFGKDYTSPHTTTELP